MLVQFDGTDYEFDLDDIDVRQAIKIQNETGLTVADMWEGFKRMDPRACLAMYWLMMAQSGKAVDMNKSNFKLVQFHSAVLEALVSANPTDESQTETQTST
jgi:hypothetical protein